MCWRSWSIAGSSRNRLASVKDMDRDTEQLNLLAIFHYVVAGLAGIFSFFPLIYTTVGVIFIFAARHGRAKRGEELPPEFLGWIFAVLGLVLFVIGIAIAICMLIAGRSLALRKRYSFALVIACIECLFVPFGTILGILPRSLRFRVSQPGHYSPRQLRKPRLENLRSRLNDYAMDLFRILLRIRRKHAPTFQNRAMRLTAEPVRF